MATSAPAARVVSEDAFCEAKEKEGSDDSDSDLGLDGFVPVVLKAGSRVQRGPAESEPSDESAALRERRCSHGREGGEHGPTDNR